MNNPLVTHAAPPQTDVLPFLKQNEVHLWIASRSEQNESLMMQLFHQTLSSEEHRTALRFHSARARSEYVMAHALLRLALSELFSVTPLDWRFGRDRNGKPIIIAPECFAPVQFSISHTTNLVTCIVTSAVEAGVDAERIEQTNDLAATAQGVCSTSELQYLATLTKEKWAPRFFDLWTLKESYAKARGLGLLLPLKSISFEIGPANSVRVRFAQDIEDNSSKWLFWLRHLPSVHTLSLAVRRVPGESWKIKERVVRFDEGPEDGPLQLSTMSISDIRIS